MAVKTVARGIHRRGEIRENVASIQTQLSCFLPWCFLVGQKDEEGNSVGGGGRASSVAYRGWTWSHCSRITAPPLLCDLEQGTCSFWASFSQLGRWFQVLYLSGWCPDSELVCVGKALRLPPDQRPQVWCMSVG